MKHKLVTVPALVAALTVSALSFRTGDHPAGAAQAPAPAPPPPWRLEDYGPNPATDNAVLLWNQQLLKSIEANPAATGPTRTSRALGILHTATYDAWAAYDGVAKGTRLGSQLRRPAAERTLANKSKAISYAAYRTLVWLFPARQSFYAAQMAAQGYPLNDPTMDRGTPEGIGNTAGQALIDFRSTDGSTATSSYAPINSWNNLAYPGKWQPLCVLTPAGVAAGAPTEPADGNCVGPNYTIQQPLTPQWGGVKPFSLTPSQYQVYGPPMNTDGTYSATEIDLALQDTANLDDVKKSQAEYWADGPGSVFPPGHDFIFAQAFSRRYDYSLDQDVKLFFTLGNAMMDAGIAAWYQKYKWDCVRPISAIRYGKAGQLVNSWLGPNKGFGMVDGSKWMPYQALNVVTPAFPEYVSGHSTFSGAGMAVLSWMTGGNTFGATVTIPAGSLKIESGPAADITFSLPTWSQTGEDAGTSRRIGGIHFKTGDLNGRALGRQVATYVYSKAQDYINGRTPG